MPDERVASDSNEFLRCRCSCFSARNVPAQYLAITLAFEEIEDHHLERANEFLVLRESETSRA